MHLYNISYTCEMSATVELCRSWTASRIIEPACAVPHRTTAGVPLCGPSIKPQVHALVFTDLGEVALDLAMGKCASRIFLIRVKATVQLVLISFRGTV